MKYDPATNARKSAAILLMRRVEAMTNQQMAVVIVPCPGDPPKGRSALERQREIDEQRAIEIAMKCNALKQKQHGGGNMFVAAKTHHLGNTEIHRSVIHRLIAKQKMQWVNSAHSAAVLTEECREAESSRPDVSTWEANPAPAIAAE